MENYPLEEIEKKRVSILISFENQKRVNDKLRKIQGTRRLIDSNSKKTKSLIPKCQKKKAHMDLLNIYKMQPIRVYF